MIVDTMNQQEICKEIASEILVVMGRERGWNIKYSKMLNNKNVASGTLLGVHTFETPRHNTAFAYLYKYALPNNKGGFINVLPFFKSGDRYYVPAHRGDNLSVSCVYTYTKHFCDRLHERFGISFTEAFKHKKGSSQIYPYEHWERQGLPAGKDYICSDFLTGMALGVRDGDSEGAIFSTIIDSTIASAAQLQDVVDMRRARAEIDDRIRENCEITARLARIANRY